MGNSIPTHILERSAFPSMPYAYARLLAGFNGSFSSLSPARLTFHDFELSLSAGNPAPRFARIHFNTSAGLLSKSLSHFVECMLSPLLPCQNSLTMSSFQLAHPVAGRRICRISVWKL